MCTEDKSILWTHPWPHEPMGPRQNSGGPGPTTKLRGPDPRPGSHDKTQGARVPRQSSGVPGRVPGPTTKLRGRSPGPGSQDKARVPARDPWVPIGPYMGPTLGPYIGSYFGTLFPLCGLPYFPFVGCRENEPNYSADSGAMPHFDMHCKGCKQRIAKETAY